MDIRLPRGNGLDLTKTIKTVFADSVICVITSYDILEYREAAFRNGADHFMVKGESTEAEIVGLIESRLHAAAWRSARRNPIWCCRPGVPWELPNPSSPFFYSETRRSNAGLAASECGFCPNDVLPQLH